MKIKMEISKSIFDDRLRDFELADAIYMAAEREFIDFDLDHGTSEEMKAVREKLHSACADRECYAVVLCKYLLSCKDFICFEADPTDAPEDSPAVDPVDSPEDSSAADPVVAPEDSPEADPVDAPEDSPAADPVDSPEDIFPVMSAKCKLARPVWMDGVFSSRTFTIVCFLVSPLLGITFSKTAALTDRHPDARSSFCVSFV